jgi:hypothetical protein
LRRQVLGRGSNPQRKRNIKARKRVVPLLREPE